MAKVTVIMPVYNGEKYLGQAINSILKQTFTDFEFLIINDGSTDDSLRILETFSDPRIKLVRHTQNIGLIETLNQAFEMAAGDYIVRMDCDDISMPTRIEKQVRFLDENSSIGVVGTSCKTIGIKTMRLRFPVQQESIRINALFDCPIAHPTVALRKSVLPVPAFDPKFKHAEDYDLWTRLLAKGVQFHSIPEFLLLYRIHDHQVSKSSRTAQLAATNTILARQLLQLGITLTEDEMRLHSMVADPAADVTSLNLQLICNHLDRLLLANEKHRVFDQQLFLQEIATRRLYVHSRARYLSGQQFRQFIHSPYFFPSFLLKKSFYKTCRTYLRSFLRKNDMNSSI